MENREGIEDTVHSFRVTSAPSIIEVNLVDGETGKHSFLRYALDRSYDLEYNLAKVVSLMGNTDDSDRLESLNNLLTDLNEEIREVLRN